MNVPRTPSTTQRGTGHIAKWGFGMAPISTRMRVRYDQAAETLEDLLDGKIDTSGVDPNHISEFKGMLNRCIRQDQWDWFTVHSELGRPPIRFLHNVAKEMVSLRKSVVDHDPDSSAEIINRMAKTGVLKLMLSSYGAKYEHQNPSDKSGWLYILSTRNQPNHLKIGMTRRDVEQRVKEINSATGVLFPFSAREVFPVHDAQRAEGKVFEHLAPFRIRNDREFFDIPYGNARNLVRKVLREENLIARQQGTITWINQEKGYGFISIETGPDIFLHISEVDPNEAPQLTEGSLLEFDAVIKNKGLAAVNVALMQNQQQQ